MSVEAPPRPETKPSRPDFDEEVMHLRCCEPDRAMCGYDLTGATWCPRDNTRLVCVVCEDFDEIGCPRCGK